MKKTTHTPTLYAPEIVLQLRSDVKRAGDKSEPSLSRPSYLPAIKRPSLFCMMDKAVRKFLK